MSTLFSTLFSIYETIWIGNISKHCESNQILFQTSLSKARSKTEQNSINKLVKYFLHFYAEESPGDYKRARIWNFILATRLFSAVPKKKFYIFPKLLFCVNTFCKRLIQMTYCFVVNSNFLYSIIQYIFCYISLINI